MNIYAGMKVAIVGCGRMGKIRAACAEALGAEVVGAFDPDHDRARELSPRANTMVDAAESLLEASPDALFICTPPAERGALEARCFERNVPFLVEKPIGLSSSLGEELLALQRARSKPLITAVGYMNRYRATLQDLRQQLQTASLVALHGTWVCGPYARDWWIDPARSGGALNEQATHLVDLFRFLGGEIVEVAGLCEDPSALGGGKSMACALRFSSGVLATLTYSCRAREKSIRLAAVTAEGSEHLEGWDFHRPGMHTATDPNGAFMAETQAFLTAVRTGNSQSVLADLKEAVATQRVVDALRTAASEGTTVRLNPPGMGQT